MNIGGRPAGTTKLPFRKLNSISCGQLVQAAGLGGGRSSTGGAVAQPWEHPLEAKADRHDPACGAVLAQIQGNRIGGNVVRGMVHGVISCCKSSTYAIIPTPSCACPERRKNLKSPRNCMRWQTNSESWFALQMSPVWQPTWLEIAPVMAVRRPTRIASAVCRKGKGKEAGGPAGPRRKPHRHHTRRTGPRPQEATNGAPVRPSQVVRRRWPLR
jgi:hypothetical protein